MVLPDHAAPSFVPGSDSQGRLESARGRPQNGPMRLAVPLRLRPARAALSLLAPSRVPHRVRLLVLLPLSLSVSLAACRPALEATPAALRLIEFTQAGSREVRLNETLQFQFSAELDRASITPASFAVEDAAGRKAEGEILLRAGTLQFVPDLPRQAGLIDGGLLPGRTYTVRLLGFPAPDGLRGLGGEPLEASAVLQFKTAGAAGDQAVFVPPISESLPLAFDCRQRVVGPLEPILLETREAVDPRSLHGDLFRLFPARSPAGEALPESEQAIPLQASLNENTSSRAVVELRPVRRDRSVPWFRALPAGSYYLVEVPEEERFRTLGGNPIAPVWTLAGASWHELRVGDASRSVRREEFDDEKAGSPLPFEEADGTAYLGGDGRVAVRFPAAAGSGSRGPVPDLSSFLSDGAERAGGVDLHATRAVLPAGETLDLSALAGPVVLRAQRSLRIEGVLRRRGEADSPSVERWLQEREDALDAARAARSEAEQLASREGAALEDGVRDALDAGVAAAEASLRLSDFLRDVQAAGLPWTFLIAGGDVVVDGTVDLDGDLVIVAGGWVRVPGRVAARRVWSTPEGGGDFGVLQDVPDPLPLRLDAPQDNPLREALSVALVTRSIRPQGGVEEWLGLTMDSDAGAGQVRVRAIGEQELGTRETAKLGPVEDLRFLRGCDSLRLVLELEVPPGPGPWDPPAVEAVEVSWSSRSGGQDRIGARGPAASGR